MPDTYEPSWSTLQQLSFPAELIKSLAQATFRFKQLQEAKHGYLPQS